MAEAQGTTESATQDMKGGAPVTEDSMKVEDSAQPEDSAKADDSTKPDNGQRAEDSVKPEDSTKKPKGDPSSSVLSKPQDLGNAAGNYIQDTMAPVSKYTGKGLETIGRPVGGIVDPLVGGVMKGGKAFGYQAGVGFGNEGGGPAKVEDEEAEKMKEPVGGEEQTADNPLGLHGGGNQG